MMIKTSEVKKKMIGATGTEEKTTDKTTLSIDKMILQTGTEEKRPAK